MPPKFGPNYVFALEGNPGKLPVSSVYKIISPLNIATTTSITIESPHNMDNRSEEVIHYDIWVTETEPQPGTNNTTLCLLFHSSYKLFSFIRDLSSWSRIEYSNTKL